MALCDGSLYDGSIVCTQTALMLPVSGFYEVEDAVRSARMSLDRASEVQWQSAAATQFRRSLEDLDAMLGVVLVMRQQAENAWMRLRAAAAAAGDPVT